MLLHCNSSCTTQALNRKSYVHARILASAKKPGTRPSLVLVQQNHKVSTLTERGGGPYQILRCKGQYLQGKKTQVCHRWLTKTVYLHEQLMVPKN